MTDKEKAEQFYREVSHGTISLTQDTLPTTVRAANERLIKEMRVRGFSVADARAYMLCFEEFSPEMPEDDAIKKMAEIQAKYPME